MTDVRMRISLRVILLALMIAGFGQMTMADDSNNMGALHRQAIQAAFDAWQKGAGGPFDLLAPDATWTITGNSPVSRTFQSKQEFIDVVITPFNQRLSKPLVPTVREIHADGDTVVALFDGEATARDGKPYRNTYAWFMQMRDGKIVRVTAFFDTIAFTDLWTRVAPR